MGQKVSPHGLRVGVIKDWDSKWYAGKGVFADMLVEDNQIRKYIEKNQSGSSNKHHNTYQTDDSIAQGTWRNQNKNNCYCKK